MDGARRVATGVRSTATLLVMLGVWATLPTVKADGAARRADRLNFAPIASSVLARPTPVEATDGRFHIVYVFSRFTFLGQITDAFTDDNLALRPTGDLPFAPSGSTRVRRHELPLDRNVLRFR